MSTVFLRQLYAKGKVSIREVMDFAISKGETVHASEGEYEEGCMISYALEEIASFWLDLHVVSSQGTNKIKEPVIELAEPLTDEQEKIYEQWQSGDITNWDNGDDGVSGEYGILDSIKWKLTKMWRKVYPNVPLLGNFTN